MRVYNTRFNPTTNGPLHIGHLYMAKINEAVAHSRPGGIFTVRFDDNQMFYQMTRKPEDLARIKQEQKEDLEWVGLQVDRWTSQSELHQQMEYFLLQVNHGPLAVHEMFQSRCNPDVLAATCVSYPYAPTLTAEKVVLDAIDYITMLIRGDDLLCEFSLYSYFCDIWHLEKPQHIYLPRMMVVNIDKKNGNPKELIENVTNVSKTRGGHTIQEYRENGYTADWLMNNLASCCLVNPDLGWRLDNLKETPVWYESRN